MSHALIRCVSSLSWEQPTVVAWDDLQWTDTASLRCLEQLLDQIALMPVVVLLTAPRSFEISWAVAPPMKLTLGPLSPAECRQLVLARVPGTRQVDEDLLQLLVEHTGGNPLLIEEILELLRHGEEIELAAGRLRYRGAAADLPDFEGVVRARLQALPPEHHEILIAAALAGPALGEEVISAATGVPPATTREILETLTEEHALLHESDAGDRAFPHERLRLAVIEAAEPSTLPGLTKRLAKAIIETQDELTTSTADHVAGLFDRSGDPVAAADLLEEAASRQQLLGDMHGAAERYNRALSLSMEYGSAGPKRELALRMRVGRAALKGLQLRLGREALDEAVALADGLEDRSAGAEARLLLSRLLSRQGRLDEAMDWAQQAVPLAKQSGDRGTLAQVYGAIAEAYQQRGLFGPDLKFVTAAIATATEAGDTLKVGEYLQLAVMHAGAVGRFDDTWGDLQRARTVADETDDPALACQLLRLEATLHLMMGDFEASLQTNLKGIARAREHGLAEAEIVMLHNAGDNHLHLDRMREALYCFSESLRRSKAIHFDRLSEANEMYIGFLEAAYLGAATGFDRLRRAIENEERAGRLWNLNQGHQLLGRAMMAHGDHESALAHLKEALRLAERTGVRYFIDEANDWLQRAGAASE
jgi:tetratricopeptide (TPR) repeat protein